jgi:phosphoglycolate phosphatase
LTAPPPTASRFPLIVFDLDGTLVDSLRDLTESANALLADAGGRPLSGAAIGRMVGDGAATLVTRVFQAAGLPQPADALPRFLSIYDSRLLTFTRAYPGVEEMLSEAATRARLAVLTNKPLGSTQQILAALGLARYFSPTRVFGGDGPLPRKPDPSGLWQLARTEGVTIVETLLVGDSLVDWRTARAAGAPVCLAAYGFGFNGMPAGALDSATGIIDRPTDLLRLL